MTTLTEAEAKVNQEAIRFTDEAGRNWLVTASRELAYRISNGAFIREEMCSVPPQWREMIKDEARHPAYKLAEDGTAAVPELESRMNKAADLVAAGDVQVHDTNEYGATGTVNGYSIKPNSCTCPDFTHRGGWCKHRLAVRMAKSLEQTAVDVPASSDVVVMARKEARENAVIQKVAAEVRKDQRSWRNYCDSSYGKRRYALKAYANGAGTASAEVGKVAFEYGPGGAG